MDVHNSSRWPDAVLRGLGLLAVAATLATGCSTDDAAGSTTTASTPAATQAEDRTEYVNLGDSFSAGTGVQPLVEDSPILCLRSSKNFAHIVAAEEDLSLTDVSCGGAETADFRKAQHEGVPPQLDAVTADADIVTVMIGGNDKETYGRTIELCSRAADTDPLGSPCTDRYGRSLIEPVATDIYPAIREALRDVKAKAPDAKVLLVGYPWLMPPTVGCYPEMKLAVGDVPMIRDLQTSLNDFGRRAAADEGVRFVDMLPASVGHDACAGPQRWIEPMTAQGPARVHPNERGQAAIAEQVRKALAN
ncbi:SGNH/GDSL hydrolase family protein [Gordonia alkanivorans]|uniref:SGNH/GDSL hydrolase family protein n=1 Tax=Gordonia alkanivorans TaxID=84096 RepID=UPI001E4FE87B|nr:SGNH/GDSL hydrolase family protein [Gordonia alkanivorans]